MGAELSQPSEQGPFPVVVILHRWDGVGRTTASGPVERRQQRGSRRAVSSSEEAQKPAADSGHG